MTPQERDNVIKTAIRDTLSERFTDDEFVFDPIVVVPTYDEFGDGDGSLYFRILVIFDGDQKYLDPDWTGGALIRRILPKLIDAGIEEIPSLGFIGKAEWNMLYPKFRCLHPEVTVETG